MDIKNNRFVWFGISTLIIVSMIYLADIDRFIDSLRTAKLLPLIPALILGLAVFPTWGYVWRRIFKKTSIDIPYYKSLKVFMAGNFLNSITPLGQAGGEPAMAYILEKNSEASYEKSLASIFSADIMNALPVVTFTLGGGIYLALLGGLNQAVLQGVYAALVAAVLGGTIVYLFWFKSGTLEKIILKVLYWIPGKAGCGDTIVQKIEDKMDRVEESFEEIGRDPRYLVQTSMFSHLSFLFQVFNFYFIMISMGYTPDITPIYFVVVLSGLANFSPTPGGSGTYEAAMAGLITVFFTGINFAIGLTVAILFRLTTYWPGILIGWIALNSLNGEVQK